MRNKKSLSRLWKTLFHLILKLSPWHTVKPTSLFYRRLRFLRNHGREVSLFSRKNGEWVVHMGVCILKRVRSKHYISLIMYGFCCCNTLYSASLLFRMFIFLSSFDTWECNNFGSNLSLAKCYLWKSL